MGRTNEVDGFLQRSRERPHWTPYCTCQNPVIELIPWFETEQCEHCGKPFKPSSKD